MQHALVQLHTAGHAAQAPNWVLAHVPEVCAVAFELGWWCTNVQHHPGWPTQLRDGVFASPQAAAGHQRRLRRLAPGLQQLCSHNGGAAASVTCCTTPCAAGLLALQRWWASSQHHCCRWSGVFAGSTARWGVFATTWRAWTCRCGVFASTMHMLANSLTVAWTVRSRLGNSLAAPQLGYKGPSCVCPCALPASPQGKQVNCKA